MKRFTKAAAFGASKWTISTKLDKSSMGLPAYMAQNSSVKKEADEGYVLKMVFMETPEAARAMKPLGPMASEESGHPSTVMCEYRYLIDCDDKTDVADTDAAFSSSSSLFGGTRRLAVILDPIGFNTFVTNVSRMDGGSVCLSIAKKSTMATKAGMSSLSGTHPEFAPDKTMAGAQKLTSFWTRRLGYCLSSILTGSVLCILNAFLNHGTMRSKLRCDKIVSSLAHIISQSAKSSSASYCSAVVGHVLGWIGSAMLRARS
jgi:hypothetical protein